MPDETITTTELTTAQCGPHRVALLTFRRQDGTDGPTPLGPVGLANLERALDDAAALADSGEVTGIVLTGAGRTFLAGADLELVRATHDRGDALELGRLGHRVITAILDAPVPTIALVNGTALGGGLEVALACSMRVGLAGARPLGLPEAHLGLIPGWGGSFLLPHLVGPSVAAEVIVANPLRGNTTLDAASALDAGLLDRVTPAGPFPAALIGELLDAPVRPRAPETSDPTGWDEALRPHRERAARAAAGGRPAPARALDLLAAAATSTRADAFTREDEALADLIGTSALHASLYALELVRRARPAKGVTSPVRTIGVIGGGLMASQLATLLAVRLGARVVMRELDEQRCARTRGLLAQQRAALGDTLPAAQLLALEAGITVGTGYDGFGEADFVIEAVFEEMDAKRGVFAEVEPRLSPGAVLATNTSALSVTAMAAGLAHPERLVGIHFFNPVAVMPLVEIVRTPHTDPAVLDAARTLAQAAGKVTVDVADAPGFIVNRLLVRMLGEVLGELEAGTDVDVVATALDPIGLPMGPLQLLQLVGPAVAAHVLHTLRAELGDRYPESPGLDAMVEAGASFLLGPPRASTPHDPAVARWFAPDDPRPSTAGQVLARVQHALAEEIHLMVDDGVAGVAAIDTAMITGANWPLHRGGITPYLDEVGAAAATGGPFHPEGI
jgi:3-hydroxyacyl-CoA dehydrogenase/enoyl-CoA hydratase/carnithine racemase